MIIVTGGAGFIGSNLIKALNERGQTDILVVDCLQQGDKFRNLVDCEILDYWDKNLFIDEIRRKREFPESPEIVFHQGACTDTTERDSQYVMRNNFEYSKTLFNYCVEHEIPFIYASSAAVYGLGPVFREERRFEKPLNIYGYSKFLFDQYVRRDLPRVRSQVVGFRYFNVYGPREHHKREMASVAYQFRQQLGSESKVRLFEGDDGYENGEQRRDFVYVDDVVKVNLWFAEHPHCSGIFNVGTGRSQSFNDVAQAVINWHGLGEIEYIPFPEHIRGHYQSFTEADVSELRNAGYEEQFLRVEEGVPKYMAWLSASGDG